jgi:hypothetical protein
MIDMTTRRHLFDLSVLATSALIIGGAAIEIARVDGERAQSKQRAEAAELTAELGPAPAPGLVRAPTGARRVVVVRRSRAS